MQLGDGERMLLNKDSEWNELLYSRHRTISFATSEK